MALDNIKFSVEVDYVEKMRSGSGRSAPAEPDSPFAQFQDRVEKERMEVEKEVEKGKKELERFRKKTERDRKKKEREDKKTEGDVTGGVSDVAGALRDPASFVTSGLGSLLKVIPYAGIAFIAFETFKYIRDVFFGPGGPGDTRLRILVENQVNTFANRQKEADLRNGKRVIRVTSSPGGRGSDSVGGNLVDLQNGGGIAIDRNTYIVRGIA